MDKMNMSSETYSVLERIETKRIEVALQMLYKI